MHSSGKVHKTLYKAEKLYTCAGNVKWTRAKGIERLCNKQVDGEMQKAVQRYSRHYRRQVDVHVMLNGDVKKAVEDSTMYKWIARTVGSTEIL